MGFYEFFSPVNNQQSGSGSVLTPSAVWTPTFLLSDTFHLWHGTGVISEQHFFSVSSGNGLCLPVFPAVNSSQRESETETEKEGVRHMRVA